MQQEEKNDQKNALCNCNFVSHWHWHLNNLCSQASYFYKHSWMLWWLWLLDALHWDNWWSLTIFCWLPSSNPHCESWSWSISSLTAGLGKSLLNSRKLRFAMPSAVPAWAIPVDGHVLIQPVALLWLSEKPDWRLRQQLHSTSLGFREISGQTR